MPGESNTHLQLKRGALWWALNHGFDLVADEVRVPKSGSRADAAACRTRKSLPVLTAVFECKQSRADFLKDSRQVVATVARLKVLHERKQTLDRLLGQHYPSLRDGEELFREFTTPVRAEEIGHKGYAAVLREMNTLQRRLYGKTKFDKLIGWRHADLHYLVVCEGIMEPHEVPAGWGILDWDGHRMEKDTEDVPRLELKRLPDHCNAGEEFRAQMLARIASAAMRQVLLRHNLGKRGVLSSTTHRS